MPTPLRAFGTQGPASLTVMISTHDGSDSVSLTFRRSLMFDRDIDGSWLIWVSTPDDDDGPTATGALAVRDPANTALLEALGAVDRSPRAVRP